MNEQQRERWLYVAPLYDAYKRTKTLGFFNGEPMRVLQELSASVLGYTPQGCPTCIITALEKLEKIYNDGIPA